MKIMHTKQIKRSAKVLAADNVFADRIDEAEEEEAEVEADIDEEIAELEETLDDDFKQDNSTVEIDNNITNHLIAECQNCHGIFISAMLASDQVIDSINGVCPLCDKDTEQALRWIIKDYPE